VSAGNGLASRAERRIGKETLPANPPARSPFQAFTKSKWLPQALAETRVGLNADG